MEFNRQRIIERHTMATEVLTESLPIGPLSHLIVTMAGYNATDEVSGVSIAAANNRAVLGRWAAVHHRQRTGADRRHGRRTVGFEDFTHHAHRVREIVPVRQHALECAFRQMTMAELATVGA